MMNAVAIPLKRGREEAKNSKIAHVEVKKVIIRDHQILMKTTIWMRRTWMMKTKMKARERDSSLKGVNERKQIKIVAEHLQRIITMLLIAIWILMI